MEQITIRWALLAATIATAIGMLAVTALNAHAADGSAGSKLAKIIAPLRPNILSLPLPTPPPPPPAYVITYMPEGRGIYNILPPEQYDHPFRGRVVIEEVSPEVIRYMCKKRPNEVTPLACAQEIAPNVCQMWKQADAVITANYPMEIVMRHEIGHCNGWSPDHGGARDWYRAAKH